MLLDHVELLLLVNLRLLIFHLFEDLNEHFSPLRDFLHDILLGFHFMVLVLAKECAVSANFLLAIYAHNIRFLVRVDLAELAEWVLLQTLLLLNFR